MIVQKRCDAAATHRLSRWLLKNQNVEPETIVTDGLRSCRAALDRLGMIDRHRPGRPRENSRTENPHLSIRQRAQKMQRSTTRSTYSGICCAATRCAYFAHARNLFGARRWCDRHGRAKAQ